MNLRYKITFSKIKQIDKKYDSLFPGGVFCKICEILGKTWETLTEVASEQIDSFFQIL